MELMPQAAQATQTANPTGVAQRVETPLPTITGVTPLARPWLAIFSATAVIITLVGTFMLYFLNVTTAAKIRRAETEANQLTEAIAREPLASVEKQVKLVSLALSGYSKATSEKLNYAFLADEVTRLTPKGTSLSSLNVDEKGAVRVSGSAASFLDAGKALLSYQTSSFFDSVKLEAITLADQGGTRRIEFSLGGNLKKNALREKKQGNVTQ